MKVIPIVIGCMGGGVGLMRELIREILINSDTDKVGREMLKTAGYGIREHTEETHHQHSDWSDWSDTLLFPFLTGVDAWSCFHL